MNKIKKNSENVRWDQWKLREEPVCIVLLRGKPERWCEINQVRFRERPSVTWIWGGVIEKGFEKYWTKGELLKWLGGCGSSALEDYFKNNFHCFCFWL
jgi:hypothetical protein